MAITKSERINLMIAEGKALGTTSKDAIARSLIAKGYEGGMSAWRNAINGDDLVAGITGAATTLPTTLPAPPVHVPATVKHGTLPTDEMITPGEYSIRQEIDTLQAALDGITQALADLRAKADGIATAGKAHNALKAAMGIGA